MIVKVENGSFYYDNHKMILRNINFDIGKNMIISVLGPNGVGKTTLLKCMMNLRKWTNGRTLIDNKEICNFTQREIWQRIAYVPQGKNLVFSFNVLDMVLLGRNAYINALSGPKKKDIEIAKQCLNEVGYYHLKDRLCNQLSGGELQMVLIARALAANPSLLVLDEPESGLDFRNQLLVLNMINKLCYERNISSIINTHYPDHALKISHKALMLNRNLESIFGNVEDIVTEENLKNYFDVNVKIENILVENQLYKHVLPLNLLDTGK